MVLVTPEVIQQRLEARRLEEAKKAATVLQKKIEEIQIFSEVKASARRMTLRDVPFNPTASGQLYPAQTLEKDNVDRHKVPLVKLRSGNIAAVVCAKFSSSASMATTSMGTAQVADASYLARGVTTLAEGQSADTLESAIAYSKSLKKPFVGVTGREPVVAFLHMAVKTPEATPMSAEAE